LPNYAFDRPGGNFESDAISTASPWWESGSNLHTPVFPFCGYTYFPGTRSKKGSRQGIMSPRGASYLGSFKRIRPGLKGLYASAKSENAVALDGSGLVSPIRSKPNINRIASQRQLCRCTYGESTSMKEWIAVLRAADMAARWHVHQRRKGIAQEPYINHPLEVASLVTEAAGGADPNVVIAALLHLRKCLPTSLASTSPTLSWR
jgi:hypothetical protein